MVRVGSGMRAHQADGRHPYATQMATGPEYYEKAMDSMMKPVNASHRPRLGHGAHSFRKQVGRLPNSRAGSRSAAEGAQPSYFEPGKLFYNDKRREPGPGFDLQTGRVPLYISGMRGAPSRFQCGVDENAVSVRPQTAVGLLRASAEGVPATSFGKSRAPRDRPMSTGES